MFCTSLGKLAVIKMVEIAKRRGSLLHILFLKCVFTLLFHSKYTTMQNMWAFKSMAFSIVAYVEIMLIAIMDWARYAVFINICKYLNMKLWIHQGQKVVIVSCLIKKTWSKS